MSCLRCQCGGLREKRTDRCAFALDGLDQLAGQHIDLVGIQRVEQRAEAADQCVQVQCRRRPRQRDGVAGLELSGSPGSCLEREIAPTDQVRIADDRLAAFGQHHGVVGAELDHRGAVILDRDLLDLADFNPRDADEVAALEPRHIAELCFVCRFVPEPQLSKDRQHGKQAQCTHGHEDG